MISFLSKKYMHKLISPRGEWGFVGGRDETREREREREREVEEAIAANEAGRRRESLVSEDAKRTREKGGGGLYGT